MGLTYIGKMFLQRFICKLSACPSGCDLRKKFCYTLLHENSPINKVFIDCLNILEGFHIFFLNDALVSYQILFYKQVNVIRWSFIQANKSLARDAGCLPTETIIKFSSIVL